MEENGASKRKRSDDEEESGEKKRRGMPAADGKKVTVAAVGEALEAPVGKHTFSVGFGPGRERR